MKCHYLSEFSEGRAVEYLETMINKFDWKKSYLADLNGQVRKAIESKISKNGASTICRLCAYDTNIKMQ